MQLSNVIVDLDFAIVKPEFITLFTPNLYHSGKDQIQIDIIISSSYCTLL